MAIAAEICFDTNTTIVAKVSKPHHEPMFSPPQMYLRARPPYCRPERTPSGAVAIAPAQPLAAQAAPEDPLREEVMPKNILMIGPTVVARPRSHAPPRQLQCALHQGRSDKIHRGRLCRGAMSSR
jgi:hypothetical protein